MIEVKKRKEDSRSGIAAEATVLVAIFLQQQEEDRLRIENDSSEAPRFLHQQQGNRHRVEAEGVEDT